MGLLGHLQKHQMQPSESMGCRQPVHVVATLRIHGTGVGQRVDVDDPVICFTNELTNQGRADEACAAGDQCGCGHV